MIRVYTGEYRHMESFVIIDTQRYCVADGSLYPQLSMAGRRAKEETLRKWRNQDLSRMEASCF